MAIGTLRANELVVVRPESEGRVAHINFAEGQRVGRGQTLVQLDASVERAVLAQAEAALSLAKANFERADELVRKGAGTLRALDEARAKLRNDEAAVQLAHARHDKMTITAPFDGVVGLRRVSVGDYLSPGADIVNLAMIDPLKVDFRVPEILLPAVAAGQPVSIAVDAFPKRAFTGEVYAIDPVVDAEGRSIVMRARMANPQHELRPGLFARVTLTLAAREGAIFVPEQAVFPVGDRQFVYRLVEGKAKLTAVKLGERRQGEVEVLDGLAAGDRAITAGLLKVRDGTAVQILEAGDRPAAAPPAGGGQGK